MNTILIIKYMLIFVKKKSATNLWMDEKKLKPIKRAQGDYSPWALGWISRAGQIMNFRLHLLHVLSDGLTISTR